MGIALANRRSELFQAYKGEASTLFVQLVVLHLAIAFAIGLITGVEFNPAVPKLLANLLGIVMPLFLWFMLVHLVWKIVWVRRSDRPLADVLKSLWALAVDHEWQIQSGIRFMLVSIFMASNGYVRELITKLNAFSWDASFAAWDRAVHFGQNPWELLMPVFGGV